jgi:outer membrane protein OmpA-like peptidoglycan-associated protein
VATDLIVARDSHAYFAAGAEWFPWDMFGFRLGIHNGPLDVAGLGDYALMTAGVGYRWEQLKIDYYFETNSEIGDAHHLTLGYRTYVAPPKPEPIYQPVTGPREEVPEIRYAAQYVFTPSPLPKDCEARELVFKVQDKDGHVLKTMAFSNGNIPKDITWDGTDEQGNFVAMQALKFSFIFQTNQGVKTQVQEWPYTEPARKLYFPEGGFGIEPEVHFSVFGKPNAVRQWQVQIVSERKGEQVYTAGGQGSVPEHLLWDGKTSNGTWADPGQKYTMRMMLNGPQGSVVIDRPVLPIYSVMLKSGSPQRVRFKIHKILFDFNQKTLPPQMSEPVLQAVAIQRKYNEKARVKINGYGDQLGSQWANYHVSRQRALDVLTFMRRNGASLSWPVQIEGMGKERLITKKMSEAERAKNRRVDIVFDVPVLETESKQKK